MRILFLSNAASIHTVRWVNALSERGHEVHLAYKFDDIPKENEISDKVNQYRLKYSGTKGYFLNVIQLKKLAYVLKPDVINAHYASGYGTLARLAKLRPLVLSVWGSDVYDFPYQNRLKMKIVVDNLKYADEIASTSHSMANQVRKLLNSKDKIIHITPFGVEIKNFMPSKKNKNNRTITLGVIKTLAPKYGIDDFIKATKFLKDNLQNYNEFVNIKIIVKIFGDGEQKYQLKKLINELELEDIVSLEGRIPNKQVPAVLNNMDIFCATSILDSESFGVAIVEAMAMELPIVATDVSGFKEVVVDGTTGIIVERQNPEKIAEALETLIFNNKLRVDLGSNGRKRVEELYNWDNNIETMLQIFLKLVNENGD